MTICFNSKVYYTQHHKIPYLKEPGIVTLSYPVWAGKASNGLKEFLAGYDPDFEFDKYLDDPVELVDSAQLCKFAGQLCYMSFGPKRTCNEDAQKYIDHIKESSHGSVLEHANFSFLFYGISRSCTHELVRHRAGMSYSQQSQRFVDGKKLRFVERPEYSGDPQFHAAFETRIEIAAQEYDDIAHRLADKQAAGWRQLEAERKTDVKKKMNQCARSLLPNETEAPIVVTANARAWRHFLEMRASEFAEIEIRELAFRTYRCLNRLAPMIFSDYEVVTLKDGTKALSTRYRKV